MSNHTPLRRFAAALQEFESRGDSSALVEMFADGAQLSRPEVSRAGSSTDDPAAYWEAYAAQFDEIRTEFHQTRETDDFGWLEWTSSGSLSTGRDIEYAGVSLLELDDGLVTRFATYYDTAAFLEPTADGS